MTSRLLNPTTYGCQTWSAIALSTPVKDTDHDGLIDALESQSIYKDPNGNAYPALGAMGASVGEKDLFVEINSMFTDRRTRAQ
jgi:hypothetical protein